jgi:hypothetical protein
MWSVSLIHFCVVLWRARKPNWLALSRLLSSMFLCTILLITFSNNFPVAERRLIGRKFWDNFLSLPGFGNGMTFASFQDFGKWDSQRQWLNKCVKCANGRLGRCLRLSFGMSSIPQDFLNFKDLITFCKTHDSILSGGLLSTASSRAWTPPTVQGFRHTSHGGVNWFSKQSVIALAFSNGLYTSSEGPWIAVGALGPSLFRRDFAWAK